VQIHVVMDSQDPDRIAPFWCGFLELQEIRRYEDGTLVLQSTSDGFLLGIQRVPEPKVGKNRAHLDVLVDDLEISTARVESLGGRWLEPGEVHALDGFPWRCMADPEGNEFCIYALSSASESDAQGAKR